MTRGPFSFVKGCFETVKKLGWSPDIVHCNDWMTSLIPMYLKTTYKNDPIFKTTKSVFTVYNSFFPYKFEGDLLDKVRMIDINDEMLEPLKSADYSGFIKIGMEHADVVLRTKEDYHELISNLLEEFDGDRKIDCIEQSGDEAFSDSYFNLYNDLANV